MHDDLMRRIDSYLAGNAPDLDGVTLVRECRTALALRTLQALAVAMPMGALPGRGAAFSELQPDARRKQCTLRPSHSPQPLTTSPTATFVPTPTSPRPSRKPSAG